MITLGLLASLLSLSEAHENCSFSDILEAGKTYYAYNPEYPEQYQGEHQCIWEMISSDTVTLNCTIEMPKSNNCIEDYLLIKFNDSESLYCGNGTFVTEGAHRIEFHSSYKTSGGKFLCKMQTVKQNVKDEYNCSCGWKNPTRIVGGHETGVNEYPMMAAIIDSRLGKLWSCGATIISNRQVVTAAHCVDRKNISEIGVLVGEHNITTGKDTSATRLYRVNGCQVHPDYQRNETAYNDIAVCEIHGTIEFSSKVGPVCLPFEHRYDSFIGSKVTLLGWGLTEFGGSKSNVLQGVDVCVTSTRECNNTYPNDDKQITLSRMCTFSPGKDACQMDSGGPALWENPCTHNMVLTGIISGGIGCASGKPAIFTRVGYYIDWIMSVTPGVQYCQLE